MTVAESLEGHCLCGAVTVRVPEGPGWVGACHCRMCQRWSGGLFLCFPAAGVTVEGPVARYLSSDFAERRVLLRLRQPPVDAGPAITPARPTTS